MTDQHPFERSRSLFAVRLTGLIDTMTRPAGTRWTYRSLAEALAASGYRVSHAHISNLCSGKANARESDMVALAELFGVPMSYFTDPDSQQALLTAAFTDQTIKNIAFRMHEAKLSPAGRDAIRAMVEHVILLENQTPSSRPAPTADESL